MTIKPKRGSIKIADVRPELASQWSPINEHPITHYSAGSNYRVWWKCDLGHEWKAMIGHRTNGSNCPYCSRKKLLSGFNDLLTMFPAVAAEWHPTLNGDLLPSEVTAAAATPVWWQCDSGHEWKAKVSNRSTLNHLCPVCTGKVVNVGHTDLLSKAPKLAAQWHPTLNHGLTPQDVSFGSKKKVWWQCARGHEWQAGVGSRYRGNGCGRCAGHIFTTGLNDLATTRPELAKQWHPTLNGALTPRDIRLSSDEPVWWQCDKDSQHYWLISPNKRINGAGCSVCAGRSVVPNVNDFASLMKDAAAEWHPTLNGDLLPTEVSLHSGKKAWWQCSNGHVWKIQISRRIRGSNCPDCPNGYNSSRGEKEVAEFVESLGFEILVNSRRTIDKLELDVYIPEKKFAIEFNGVYWHSEAGGKDSKYHANKVQLCEDKGITLYQVWEDDWRLRSGIVKRGIAHRLGATERLGILLPHLPAYWSQRLGAKQTQVVVLETRQAFDFLNSHHIQGAASGLHYLGLLDSQDRLRAVMVLRRGKGESFTIERYATAGVIVGGFTKLLSYFEKNYDIDSFVTFSDTQLSNGRLYADNGFIVDKVLPPDYSYLVDSSRIHKFNYRKSRFKKDPQLIFAEGLTEKELAAANGLVRIWDSGKLRWVKKVLPT